MSYAKYLLCRKYEDRTTVYLSMVYHMVYLSMVYHMVYLSMVYHVPEYGVGGGEHDGLPLQQVEVPHPHRHAEREPVQEALEEPLEGVETSRDVLIQQVLLQPPQLLVKNLKLEMIRNSNL